MNRIENTWRLVPADAAQHELAEVRAALGFLPQGYAAMAGLDRLGDLLAASSASAPSEPITVAVDSDTRGVSVGVWQGSQCVYSGAHPLPAAPGVSTVEDEEEPPRLPYVVERILKFAGQSKSLVTLPNLSAQQAIDLANWIQANFRPASSAGDARGAVTLITRQGRGQELFTYTSQPCDSVIAWRIGEACSKASQASAGDYIDRGLSLLKELQRKGYGIADISSTQRQGDA